MPDAAGWPARFALAWRILTYDKGRTALAVAGVLLAILLVFVQLGFFIAVPRGGMLLYDRLRFDLLVASTGYEYQVQPGAFALSLLDKARTVPDVALAASLYFGSAKWRSGEDGKAPDVFVIGLDPQARVFATEELNRQLAILDRADTILVDSTTRAMFGPLTKGRVVDIDGDKLKIGGDYVLGTGFMGLGVILVSAENFIRLFPYRMLGQVNLGLLRVKPGVAPDHAAAALGELLGGDVRIFTRAELEAHETAYWTTRTSVGLLFGSG